MAVIAMVVARVMMLPSMPKEPPVSNVGPSILKICHAELHYSCPLMDRNNIFFVNCAS